MKEDIKKKEAEDKKKKEEEAAKPKFEIYEIKVEATVPCSMTFRIRAETVEEALKKFDKQPPTQFQPYIVRKKINKATVYKAGTTTILGTKKYK